MLVGLGISEVGIKVVGWIAEGRGVVTFWLIIPWELSTVIGSIIKLNNKTNSASKKGYTDLYYLKHVILILLHIIQLVKSAVYYK